jgi:hypothetical protein
VIQRNAETLAITSGGSNVRERISTEIVDAIRELRRRGDTIVRRRDLHAVLPLVDARDGVDAEAWRRRDGAQ